MSHIQSFPSQTASAEYVCPTCSSPIWPPKLIKDTGSCLHLRLRDAVIQSGMEKNVFGNHTVSASKVESRAPPPAFSSNPFTSAREATQSDNSSTNTSTSFKDSSLESPLVGNDKNPLEIYSTTVDVAPKLSAGDAVEINASSPEGKQVPNFVTNASPNGAGPSTRKGSYDIDRQSSGISYHTDDEDGTRNKYTRRGPFRHKFLRSLLPFWSSTLPTLPVTAPSRKDGASDNVPEGRSRRQRSRRMDPRKILLAMAIMACMATIGILYYRLAQGLGGEMTQDKAQ